MSQFAANATPPIMATAQAVPVQAPDTAGLGVNVNAAAHFLQQSNWPEGLANLMIDGIHKTCYRIFIVDDSGSMGHGDGNKLQTTSRGLHVHKIRRTRWAEMVEAIKFHAAFAEAANAPSEFRLLNNGNPIVVGGGLDTRQNAMILNSLLDGSPGGMTPLCRHVAEVVVRVKSMEHQLKANGQKVSLTIFTDGKSSDGDVSKALEPLSYLPVRVIIRLCTDDDSVVNYWNHVDDNIELQMDCLDDLFGENDEVRSKNRWLTYGVPLHRLREFGCHLKEFDLLDETKLSESQIRTVIAHVLGGPLESYPHPSMDKKRFLKYVKEKLVQSPMTICPEKKVMRPWIRTQHLPGAGACTIS